MRHLVQDVNGDGMFDRYFHLKSMTVVGHIGRDRSGWLTLNGSSNWSGRGIRSDENVGVHWRKRITERYRSYLGSWFSWDGFNQANRYRSTRMTRTAAQDGRLVDGLLFGSVLALGAVGLTLTYSILGFANFTHGDLITWGAYFFLSLALVWVAAGGGGLGHIGPTTATAGGKIIIAGGQQNSSGETMIRDVYVYNSATGQWSANTLLPAGRKSSGTVVIDGKVYVATGNIAHSPYISSQLWIG